VTQISSKTNNSKNSNKSAVKTILMKMNFDVNFCYYFADRKKRIEKFCHRILIKKSLQVKTEMKFHPARQKSLHKTEMRGSLSQKKSP